MNTTSEQPILIDQKLLPKGTSELIWVHPLGIDFNEVLSTMKQKKYEPLLYDKDLTGMSTVSCLPQLDTKDRIKTSIVSEYTMLISSIEFDMEERFSASMIAIMKTLQSLYFLGKTAQLPTQKSKEKHNNIVPVVIQ